HLHLLDDVSLHPLVLILRPPPPPTLSPYTTLFRSLPPLHRPTDTAAATHRQGRRAADPRGHPPMDADRKSVGASSGTGTNRAGRDRKSTRLNSSHVKISYAVCCLKKKNETTHPDDA